MAPLRHHERLAAKAPAPYVDSDDDSIFGQDLYTHDNESFYFEDMSIQSEESSHGEASRTPTSSNNTPSPKHADEARVKVSERSLEQIMNAIDRCVLSRSAFSPGSSIFHYYTHGLQELQEEYHQVLVRSLELDFSNGSHGPDEVKSRESRTLVDQPSSPRDSENAPKKKWSTVKMVSDWASPPRGFCNGQAVTYTISAPTKDPRKVDGAPNNGPGASSKKEKESLVLLTPTRTPGRPVGDPIKPSESAQQITTTKADKPNQDKDVEKGKQRDSVTPKSSNQGPAVKPKTSKSSRNRNPLPQSTPSTLEHPPRPIEGSAGLRPTNTRSWDDFERHIQEGDMQVSPRVHDYRPATRDVNTRSLRANISQEQERKSHLLSDLYSEPGAIRASAAKSHHVGDRPVVLRMSEYSSSSSGTSAATDSDVGDWPVLSFSSIYSPLIRPSPEASVPATKSPKPADYTVTYWATVEHGEQTAHISIESSNVSGSEKTIIEGNSGMKKVWKWVQEKGLDGKVSLQDAFELAKDMHCDTKAAEAGNPWGGVSGW